MISGRTLPDVPVSHRPIFQVAPLEVVNHNRVAHWLRKAYKDQNLSIEQDSVLNALVLKGTPDIVNKALQSLQVLDQPFMRGRHSLRVDPVHVKPEKLAKNLKKMLEAEGYGVSVDERDPSGSSVIFIPLENIGALFMFCSTSDTLEHIKQWVNQLDQPKPLDQIKNANRQEMFYYQVQNTRSQRLKEIVGKLLPNVQTKKKEGEEGAQNQDARNLVVDETRNALIYQGNPKVWRRIKPILHKMDQPARMVLVEVTVAEITLTDKQELGVEWLVKDLGIGEANVEFGTRNGLNIGSSGMHFLLDNAGETSAVLNAFASKNRINIVSTPRLMVKSGMPANINVGQEVPIVTTKTEASDLSEEESFKTVEEIQYQKTGVQLNIKPIVLSGNRVDLEIKLNDSETQTNKVTDVNDPIIFNRTINTNLGLSDGSSILLGGLISSKSNEGTTGTPYLQDIPLLGNFFKVNKESIDKTELIMLIKPYVIGSNKKAKEVTNELTKSLQELDF